MALLILIVEPWEMSCTHVQLWGSVFFSLNLGYGNPSSYCHHTKKKLSRLGAAVELAQTQRKWVHRSGEPQLDR